MIEIIKASISNQKAEIEVFDNIYSNNKDQYKIHFVFTDDSWNNYNKMVVFDRVKNYDTPIGIDVSPENSNLVEIINDKEFYCVLPWEVITQAGYFNISINGSYTNETGELVKKNFVLPTKFTIQDGGDTTVYPRVPTPNMYEQLGSRYQSIKEIAEEANEKAAAASQKVDGYDERIDEIEKTLEEGGALGEFEDDVKLLFTIPEMEFDWENTEHINLNGGGAVHIKNAEAGSGNEEAYIQIGTSYSGAEEFNGSHSKLTNYKLYIGKSYADYYQTELSPCELSMSSCSNESMDLTENLLRISGEGSTTLTAGNLCFTGIDGTNFHTDKDGIYRYEYIWEEDKHETISTTWKKLINLGNTFTIGPRAQISAGNSTSSKHYTFVLGDENELNSSNSIVVGKYNKINGDYVVNAIFGESNIVEGKAGWNLIGGTSHKITGVYGFAAGYGNEIRTNMAAALGRNNKTSDSSSRTVGQLVVGRFNDYTSKALRYGNNLVTNLSSIPNFGGKSLFAKGGPNNSNGYNASTKTVPPRDNAGGTGGRCWWDGATVSEDGEYKFSFVIRFIDVPENIDKLEIGFCCTVNYPGLYVNESKYYECTKENNYSCTIEEIVYLEAGTRYKPGLNTRTTDSSKYSFIFDKPTIQKINEEITLIDDAVFLVGNGQSDNERTNAFVVYSNGDAKVFGDLLFDSNQTNKKVGLNINGLSLTDGIEEELIIDYHGISGNNATIGLDWKIDGYEYYASSFPYSVSLNPGRLSFNSYEDGSVLLNYDGLEVSDVYNIENYSKKGLKLKTSGITWEHFDYGANIDNYYSLTWPTLLRPFIEPEFNGYQENISGGGSVYIYSPEARAYDNSGYIKILGSDYYSNWSELSGYRLSFTDASTESTSKLTSKSLLLIDSPNEAATSVTGQGISVSAFNCGAHLNGWDLSFVDYTNTKTIIDNYGVVHKYSEDGGPNEETYSTTWIDLLSTPSKIGEIQAALDAIIATQEQILSIQNDLIGSGDIETALDNILEIQNELIGGE